MTPTPSVTMARMGYISRQPHTSAAVSTTSSSLAHLLVKGQGVALHGRGEAALRREAQLIDGDVARGLFDPPLELVLGLELAALGGDEAEHDQLVLGHEPQRLEPSGAGVVVLEEEAIHVELAEQRLGDEVVATLGGPRGAEIAAAHVGGHRHPLGAVRTAPR